MANATSTFAASSAAAAAATSNNKPETGKFNNHPLPSSIIFHGEGSNNLSGGVQALIIQDVDAYEPLLCLDSYRKNGLPTPPSLDPTIQWLKQSSPNNNSRGYVFLQ